MKTIDLSTWNRNCPLVIEEELDQPTRIYVNGRRVNEPTTVVDGHGGTVAVDMLLESTLTSKGVGNLEVLKE